MDLRVLKEEPENTFILLEREEQEGSSGVTRNPPRAGECSEHPSSLLNEELDSQH